MWVRKCSLFRITWFHIVCLLLFTDFTNLRTNMYWSTILLLVAMIWIDFIKDEFIGLNIVVYGLYHFQLTCIYQFTISFAILWMSSMQSQNIQCLLMYKYLKLYVWSLYWKIFIRKFVNQCNLPTECGVTHTVSYLQQIHISCGFRGKYSLIKIIENILFKL